MATKKTQDPSTRIADNKKAAYNYFFEELFEAGMVLEGWEVKSLREGKVQLTDGYVVIRNGELFIVLKMMVGSNLKDQQLQQVRRHCVSTDADLGLAKQGYTMLTQVQIVDKTIMEADLDRDGKISFEEFTKMVENTDVSMSMTLDQF